MHIAEENVLKAIQTFDINEAYVTRVYQAIPWAGTAWQDTTECLMVPLM